MLMRLERWNITPSFLDHIRYLILRSVQFENIRSPQILLEKLKDSLCSNGVDISQIQRVSFTEEIRHHQKSWNSYTLVTAAFSPVWGKEERISYPRDIDFLWEAEKETWYY